jgi:hypothetical protein
MGKDDAIAPSLSAPEWSHDRIQRRDSTESEYDVFVEHLLDAGILLECLISAHDTDNLLHRIL